MELNGEIRLLSLTLNSWNIHGLIIMDDVMVASISKQKLKIIIIKAMSIQDIYA